MRPFTYERPASLADAVSLQAGGDGSSQFLAGGTDLLTLMKHDLATPDRLVDIKRLPDLDDTIASTSDGGLRIGALATLAHIEKQPLVRERHTALADAAALAATPQLRNMATIGGNLLQRPRCWYFRSPHVECWLKGGHDCPARDGDNRYHALFGDSPCVAVHPSDPATAMLALDASVEFVGPGGARTVPVGELYALPTEDRRTETTLHPGEVMTAILLPPRPATANSAYLKAMDRKVWAFATVAVAASLEVEDGVVRSARLALGGVAPVPWNAPEAASLLVGQAPTGDLYGKVADAALEGAMPLAHNAYKVPLLKALIRRVIVAAANPEA
jgi:xanthine dehydrogenase YagS FAD-binding subunit